MHTALYSASCNNIILIVNTKCTCDTKIHIKLTQEVPTLLRARTLLLASSMDSKMHTSRVYLLTQILY